MSNIDLVLLKTLQEFECHINWIQELLPNLEKSIFQDKSGNLQQYILSVLDEGERMYGLGFKDGENDKEDTGPGTLSGEIYHTDLGQLGHQINMAFFCIYVCDHSSARHHLKKANALLEKALSGKKSQFGDRLATFQYCIKAGGWLLTMLDIKEGNQRDKDEEKLELEAKALKNGWKGIQKSGKDLATVHFLRGFLGVDLKVKEEITREHYIKAIKLDPDFHMWHHFAYKITRRIRRCYKLGELKAPDIFESAHCKKAYSLRKACLPIILDYAQLLKEAVWMEKEKVWTEKAEDLDKCATLFEEALTKANLDTSHNGRFWLGKVKLYYGEFLLHGKDRNSDQEKGKQLYDECIRDFPRCQFVMFKMAKLHHVGTFYKKLYKDAATAENYYLEASKSEQNLTCIRDYMSLLIEGDRLPEVYEFIDEFVKTCKRIDFIVKLRMIRGCIQIVRQEHKGAIDVICESWIATLLEYPEHWKDAYSAFWWKYKRGNGKTCLVKKSIVIHRLKKIMISNKDKKEIEAISSLMDELKRQEKSLKERIYLKRTEKQSQSKINK